MAKSPDKTALGPTQAPRATRPVQGVRQVAAGYERGISSASRFAGEAGEGLQRMADATFRLQERDDTVERARAITEFSRTVSEQFRRMQTERDFSKNETGREFVDFVKKTQADLLGAHSGTPASKDALSLRLAGMGAEYIDRAAVYGLQAKKMVTNATMTDGLNGLMSKVYDDPASFADAVERWDALRADMAGALTPEEEEQYHRMTESIAVSAVTSYLDRGDYEAADAFLEKTPGLSELLSGKASVQLKSRITAQRTAALSTENYFQKKLDQLKSLLPEGEEPTPEQVQRLREHLIGQALGGDKPLSPAEEAAQKLNAYRAATGKEPTEAMIARAHGLGNAESYTTLTAEEALQAGFPPGSLLQINNATNEIKVLREGGAELNPTEKVNLETKLRGEFTRLTDKFSGIRDSYAQISAAAATPSAAGDLAIIFSYMKLLDPTSVVREGEQATAQNAAGVPDQVRNLYNRLLTGERLGEEQRKDFVDTAGEVYGATLRQYRKDEARYRGLAGQYGLDANRVVYDVSGGLQPTTPISTGSLPAGIPEGSKLVGTLDGYPVYETPDGKRIQVK